MTNWRELLNTSRLRDRRDRHALKLLLSFAIPSDGNCIDVGAHRGDVLREIVRVAPNGHHIAFEPLPGFAETLKAQFPTVDVRATALSNSIGDRMFVHVVSSPGYSGFLERRY